MAPSGLGPQPRLGRRRAAPAWRAKWGWCSKCLVVAQHAVGGEAADQQVSPDGAEPVLQDFEDRAAGWPAGRRGVQGGECSARILYVDLDEGSGGLARLMIEA